MRFRFAHVLIGKPVPTFPGHALTRLLGVRLELRFQRRQLGEWRIRIGLTTVAVVASPLDVFGAQCRIAVRTIATGRPVGAIAALLTIRTTLAVGTLGPIGTR